MRCDYQPGVGKIIVRAVFREDFCNDIGLSNVIYRSEGYTGLIIDWLFSHRDQQDYLIVEAGNTSVEDADDFKARSAALNVFRRNSRIRVHEKLTLSESCICRGVRCR